MDTNQPQNQRPDLQSWQKSWIAIIGIKMFTI
jgi:hypothetical protein